MSTDFAWLAALLSTDAPALPAPWAMRLGLSVGWALVLALLGAGLGSRLSLGRRRLLAASLALWALLPGLLTPDYWLGLAFHTPSLTAMVLSVWALQRLLFLSIADAATLPTGDATGEDACKPGGVFFPYGLLLPLVALGYLLLLDTFAVLPLQIYAWGFSPLLLMGLLALSLLPWLLRGAAATGRGSQRWLLPASLLVFAFTRLPTGNVWDALIDPWLWLFLNGALLRAVYRRWRDAKALAPQI
jgi:hypothetical protein